MKRILSVGVVMVAAVMLFAPTAHAEIYVGGSVTQTAIDIDNVNFDEDDTGFKIFGGWTFFKFVGLEAGYYDMGNQENLLEDIEITAYALSARGILPIGDHFEIFAKAGYMIWDLESPNGDEDDNDIIYGAGIAFVFGGHLSIRAEYEILDVDGADIDLYSIGAAFRF